MSFRAIDASMHSCIHAHMHGMYKSSSDGISLNHLSLTFLLTSPRHHVRNVASQKGARIEESFFAHTRLEYQRFEPVADVRNRMHTCDNKDTTSYTCCVEIANRMLTTAVHMY